LQNFRMEPPSCRVHSLFTQTSCYIIWFTSNS
jgi:hypothetical protein